MQKKPTQAMKVMTAAVGLAAFWIFAQALLGMAASGGLVPVVAAIAGASVAAVYWRVVTRNVIARPKAGDRRPM